MYADIWWNSLKNITDLRNEYLEFICFLEYADESPLKNQMNGSLADTFKKTVNKWIAFRNGIMRAKISNNFDYKKLIERLDNLIAFEEMCALELKKIISK